MDEELIQHRVGLTFDLILCNSRYSLQYIICIYEKRVSRRLHNNIKMWGDLLKAAEGFHEEDVVVDFQVQLLHWKRNI